MQQYLTSMAWCPMRQAAMDVMEAYLRVATEAAITVSDLSDLSPS